MEKLLRTPLPGIAELLHGKYYHPGNRAPGLIRRFEHSLMQKMRQRFKVLSLIQQGIRKQGVRGWFGRCCLHGSKQLVCRRAIFIPCVSPGDGEGGLDSAGPREVFSGFHCLKFL